MSAVDIVSELVEFGPRAPGSEAERRAAQRLAQELRAHGRTAGVEPFWCRPNWPLAHAWHVALGLGGSLVSVSAPRVGGAMLLVALLSLVSDELLGISLGRRLTPERASQNVVSQTAADDRPVRLLITANYDAGRAGLVYRGWPRIMARRLRRTCLDLPPGWLAWLALALAWLLVIALLRISGARNSALGIAQLIPTVGLVLALALLLELAGSEVGPGAGDNGTGVAVALALARALDAAPPRRLAVEIVIEGAGEGGRIGLRRHLRAHRHQLSSTNTIVLGIGACGNGRPRWWMSDGALIPLRYHSRLRALSTELASAEPQLDAAQHRGRGASPALPARYRGLPSIALGCLDRRGLAPRSHTPNDTPELLDQSALDTTLQLALMLVDAVDADLARSRAGETASLARHSTAASRA